MSAADPEDDYPDPQPPFIESADEIDDHLAHRGASLYRFAYHNWWIARGTPTTDRITTGVCEPAIAEWCRRHGVAWPANDAECVTLRRPRDARPGDVGFERFEPGAHDRVAFGDRVAGRDHRWLRRPRGATLVACGLESNVRGVLDGWPPGTVEIPTPGGRVCSAGDVRTMAYRLLRGSDTVAESEGLRLEAANGPWRTLAEGAGQALARGAPLDRWLTRSFLGRVAEFAAGMPRNYPTLWHGAGERRVLVLARGHDADETVMVVQYLIASPRYAPSTEGDEFAGRRYMVLLSIEPPAAPGATAHR